MTVPLGVNLPNSLTIGRIAATPAIAALIMNPPWQYRLSALVLFIVAAVTDYYDGKLARSRNLVTRRGSCSIRSPTSAPHRHRRPDVLAHARRQAVRQRPGGRTMGGRDRRPSSVRRPRRLSLRHAVRPDAGHVVDRRGGHRSRAVHDALSAARRASRRRDQRHRPGQVEDGLSEHLGRRGLLLVLRRARPRGSTSGPMPRGVRSRTSTASSARWR